MPQEVGEVVLALPEGEWDQKVKLAFEREMLGLYVSDHPLLGVTTSLRRVSSSGVPELWEQPDGASCHHRGDGRCHKPAVHPERRSDALLPM